MPNQHILEHILLTFQYKTMHIGLTLAFNVESLVFTFTKFKGIMILNS